MLLHDSINGLCNGRRCVDRSLSLFLCTPRFARDNGRNEVIMLVGVVVVR